MQTYDDIVIGQGIAGTTVAWQLLKRGAKILIVDREPDITSSKIAAGLITPITGRNLKPAWQWDQLWPFAKEFYRDIESRTGTSFFHEVATVRIFANDHQRAATARRNPNPSVHIEPPEIPLTVEHFHAPFGTFEMSPAARLDVPEYLSVSRRHLASIDSYRAATVDVAADIQFAGDMVSIPRLDVTATRLTFCQGFAGQTNPWFPNVRFDASQGEILTVHCPGLTERRVVRHGIWLAPIGDGLFKVGSTYDRDRLDGVAIETRRDEICEQLQRFLKLPFTVVDHAAAVRPNLVGRHPGIGRHSQHPQLACFNGLGSKGTLQAPYFANQMADLLIDDTPPDTNVDLATRFTSTGERQRLTMPLTQLAHRLIREVLSEGDVAIDATAGNGYDTRSLAQTVGPTGHVYSFDIQEAAIERTKTRLNAVGITNVTLHQRSHAEMADAVDRQHHGQIAAVMFNLGYLPNGNKTITTQPTSTREAIIAATRLIRSGGRVTVLVYIGHEGGRDEASMVDSVLNALPADRFEVQKHTAPTERAVAPILYSCTAN